MALFKVFRGNRSQLDQVEKIDGHAYFCKDDGTFWIDYQEGENIVRKQLKSGAQYLGTVSSADDLISRSSEASTGDYVRATAAFTYNDEEVHNSDLLIYDGSLWDIIHSEDLLWEQDSNYNSQAKLNEKYQSIEIGKFEEGTYVDLNPTDGLYAQWNQPDIEDVEEELRTPVISLGGHGPNSSDRQVIIGFNEGIDFDENINGIHKGVTLHVPLEEYSDISEKPNRTIAIKENTVQLTGDQTIGGTKTFTNNPPLKFSNENITEGDIIVYASSIRAGGNSLVFDNGNITVFDNYSFCVGPSTGTTTKYSQNSISVRSDNYKYYLPSVYNEELNQYNPKDSGILALVEDIPFELISNGESYSINGSTFGGTSYIKNKESFNGELRLVTPAMLSGDDNLDQYYKDSEIILNPKNGLVIRSGYDNEGYVMPRILLRGGEGGPGYYVQWDGETFKGYTGGPRINAILPLLPHAWSTGYNNTSECPTQSTIAYNEALPFVGFDQNATYRDFAGNYNGYFKYEGLHMSKYQSAYDGSDYDTESYVDLTQKGLTIAGHWGAMPSLVIEDVFGPQYKAEYCYDRIITKQSPNGTTVLHLPYGQHNEDVSYVLATQEWCKDDLFKSRDASWNIDCYDKTKPLEYSGVYLDSWYAKDSDGDGNYEDHMNHKFGYGTSLVMVHNCGSEATSWIQKLEFDHNKSIHYFQAIENFPMEYRGQLVLTDPTNNNQIQSRFTLLSSQVTDLFNTNHTWTGTQYFDNATYFGGGAIILDSLPSIRILGTVGTAGQVLYSGGEGGGMYWGDAPSGGNSTDTNYYHTPNYSTGLQIATGTGVNNLYVPKASETRYGVVKMYTDGTGNLYITTT